MFLSVVDSSSILSSLGVLPQFCISSCLAVCFVFLSKRLIDDSSLAVSAIKTSLKEEIAPNGKVYCLFQLHQKQTRLTR